MTTDTKTVDDLLGEVESEWGNRNDNYLFAEVDDLLDYAYEKYGLHPEEAPKAGQIVDDYEEAIWDAAHQ